MLIATSPPHLQEALAAAVEDPSVDPADASHMVSCVFRFHASISPKMVEWHRHRGEACPCRSVRIVGART
jgi:hypothetical protein